VADNGPERYEASIAAHTPAVSAIFGGYEVLQSDRDETVSTLRILAQYGEEAATGEQFILHLGI
jgi:hypothetical protein